MISQALSIAIKKLAAYAGMVCAIASFVLITGCASGPTAHPQDPLEPMNRSITRFNDGLDTVLFRPVATAYKQVLPPLVRTGVSNFFNNLTDLWTFFNSLLQGKGQAAGESFMRFNVNTVMGLGGVLDIASEMGIERHREDFGQTLGYWGVPTGPYLVLPVLGPSSLRDTAALAVDVHGDLLKQVDQLSSRSTLVTLRAINLRANLLRASNVLDEAALDKYTFTRDVYFQRRRSQVLDGGDAEVTVPPIAPAASAAAGPTESLLLKGNTP